MLETYSFMHPGNKPEYIDSITVGYAGYTMCGMVDGRVNSAKAPLISSAIKNIMKSAVDGSDFASVLDSINEEVYQIAKKDASYMIIRLSDNDVEINKYGDFNCYLIRNGEILDIPNGKLSLLDDDRMLFCTSTFMTFLNREAILADSLTSISSEEWIQYLVARISDANMLMCDNLTALAIIVRQSDDDMRFDRLFV